MNPSASPKPASGPVRGLTCPILITRLWALAGITPSTAGAAMAPTSVRREIPNVSLGMWISLVASSSYCSGVARTRLLQVLQDLRSQRGLRVRAPFAEALARFEAELLLLDERFEIGRRPCPALDIGKHRLMDRQRQIGADEIGVLQRTQHRQPPAEACLDHGVHGLGVADATLDQRDGFPP